MKKLFLLFLILLMGNISYGQNGLDKPVYVYDLTAGSIDSITNIVLDTSIVKGQTDFYTGHYNSYFESLAVSPPFTNTFPNSHFTLKKRASEDYDLTNFPIRTSVKIFSIDHDTLNNNCSGSFISRRHVLTAAHCISDINTNNLRHDSLYVCPIYDNGEFAEEFDCSYVSKIYFIKDWGLSNSEDFAVLELEESIGSSTGWLSIGFNTINDELLQGIFYKFSYPAVTLMALDSNYYNGDSLYYNYGLADLIDENFIGITGTNGIPGESGSSIIKVENYKHYTTYGVLSWSNNLRHSRIDNRMFHVLKEIIAHDIHVKTNPVDDPSELTAYPNPTTGVFYIENLHDAKTVDLTVYDLWGRTIVHKKPFPKSGLDLSGFPDGCYYIKIQSGDKTEICKIIKQGS